MNGKLDLRGWNFAERGPVRLAGQFEFYWQQHLTSSSFQSAKSLPQYGFIPVPSNWNDKKIHGQVIDGIGIGTYRARLFLDRDSPALGLKIRDMGTAFRVFANGIEIGKAGQAGKKYADTRPEYRPAIFRLPGNCEEIELIFHVSNFHHARGGAWEPILLGTIPQLRSSRENLIFLGMVALGSILIMGLYHLCLYIFRRSERASLYFALLTFAIAVRMLTTDERMLLHMIPSLSWQTFMRIEYLSFYLCIPFLAWFLQASFRRDFPGWAIQLVVAISLFSCAIVLIAPVIVFTSTLFFHQCFMIACILYTLIILIMAIKRHRKGARIFALGFTVLSIAVINDILDNWGIAPFGHLVHIGLIFFIFCQAFLISYRFSEAFKTRLRQRGELDEAIGKLKEEMHRREEMEDEKRRLEGKLARAQKMESIGMLAGGVAHDLNNILSGTVTYPDLLLMDMPSRSPFRPALETIKQSGLKAAAIVEDLLTLARRGAMSLKPLNLNQVVDSYIESQEFRRLQNQHPQLKISRCLDDDLHPILGSEIHLRKSFMNLINNSVEAGEQGGEVYVSTGNRYLDVKISRYEDVKTGTYAVLSVQDPCLSIPQQHLEKIFEPFYTRKVMGFQGTGLGLSIVWGAIHDHDGYIDVISQPADGTTFELYLPVPADELSREPEPAEIDGYLGNGELVLVVDDDIKQCQIARKVLERLNYRVETVRDGLSAIQFVAQKSVDLVLLDMIMDPGIDGLETFRQLKYLRPDIRALVASGFSETERVQEALRIGVGAYIRKPYTFERIARSIKIELTRSRISVDT